MISDKSFPHISIEAKFADTAIFIGDVYIHENCVIEDKVMIDGSDFRVVINAGCLIGEGTKIKGTGDKLIIGRNSVIGKYCTINHSIGENASIADNSKI